MKKIRISTLERVYYNFVFYYYYSCITSRRKLINVWILLSNALDYSSIQIFYKYVHITIL